jgi:hypothetical protein
MLKRFTFLILLSLLLGTSRAQFSIPCSADEAWDQFTKKHPEVAQNWQKIKALAAYYDSPEAKTSANSNIITIPVVVHVVWNTPSQNISLAQIQSQLDVLNEDFRRLNADTFKTRSVFKPVAGDALIQFCLAKRSPVNDTTSGITRTQSSVTSWGCTDSVKFSAYGGKDGWPGNKYLNIWVCNLNCANGYAYYPGTPDPYDGVVVHYYVFGRTGNIAPGYKGRTGTHEVGHYLGLYHTFDYGSCGGNTPSSCAGGGDEVCDTPASNFPNYGCGLTANTCSDSPTNLPDQMENYMDYADDSCRNMFSNGQIQRMRSLLLSYRSGLVTSTGCIPAYTNYTDAIMAEILSPIGYGCSGSVNPTIKVGNAGTSAITTMTVAYQLDMNPVQQFTYTGSIASGSFATISLPALSVSAGNHTLSVNLTNPNNTTDQNLSNNTVITTFKEFGSGSGIPLNATEGFEGSVFLPTDWILENPNNDQYWKKTSVASGFGTSSSCAVFKNFYNGSTNKKDAMISAPYDLSGPGTKLMTFNVAYADPASTFYSDTLKVWASSNCGNTWTQLYVKGGTTLSTAPPMSSFAEFVPTNTEWRTETVSLNTLSGNSLVSFKFQNVSYWGNDLYVDDINISASTGIELANAEVSNLYYNPTNSSLVFVVPDPETEIRRVKIYDVTGKIVSEGKPQQNRMEISSLSQGYYLVTYETNTGNNGTRRFIKAE